MASLADIFRETAPTPLDLTPDPMRKDPLEALRHALPGAAARARVARFQPGTPSPTLLHDIGQGYGGGLGSLLASVVSPPDLHTGDPFQEGADYAAQLGIFGGVGSHLADYAAQKEAAYLEAQGVHPDQIWKRTGWGTGAENLWRNEIDDGPMTHSLIGQGASTPIQTVVDHPDLFKAYPHLKQINVDENPYKGGGWYNGATTIGVGTRGGDYNEIKDTILHELQHAIQQHEGFARGGAPDLVAPGMPSWDLYQGRLKELLDARTPPLNFTTASSQYYGMPPAEFAAIDLAARRYGSKEAYRRLAGEVEARNAGTRMNMAPRQRLDTPPTWTEDYPRDQQIVKRRIP